MTTIFYRNKRLNWKSKEYLPNRYAFFNLLPFWHFYAKLIVFKNSNSDNNYFYIFFALESRHFVTAQNKQREGFYFGDLELDLVIHYDVCEKHVPYG